jgi:hypothetical protein
MSLKQKEASNQPIENVLDDEWIINLELALLTFNMKREVSCMLNFFFSILKKYEEKKSHKMFPFTLTLRYKGFPIVSSLIDHDKEVSIVEG